MTPLTQTISTRVATADDVKGIVSLLNVAFAMERDFVDRDRASAAEIAHYLESGAFFVVDSADGALAS